MISNLTIDEIAVLSEEFNLTDGHAYRPWTAAESAIIARVPELFGKADRRDHNLIETTFLETFLAAAQQSFDPDVFDFKLCFTASTALEVIANYLRITGRKVALVEPCFDNLHDILARHHVPLMVFPEDLMAGDALSVKRFIDSESVDAVFLVSPNNPTGAQISIETFTTLARSCREHGKLLILDATFRFYAPRASVYDAYAILAEEGPDCFIIEDTGKTWPTLELKAPFFSASKSIAEQVFSIYSDFVLHVSPVSVLLVTEFLKLPHDDCLGHTQAVIARNRERLVQALDRTPIKIRNAQFMSVAWLETPHGMTGSELRDQLAEIQVHGLSGDHFFWNEPERGRSFFRLALLRDEVVFDRAMESFEKVAHKLLQAK